MGFYPYNPNLGQRVQTGIKGADVDAGYVAHLVWDNPAASNAALILNDSATSNTAATVVTVFIDQPDFARQISITPGGTTADVAAGNITVEGKDAGGNVISEDVAIAADAATAVFTTKAFKEITKITFPQQDGAAATYDVGVTDKLGVPYALSHNTILSTFFNNVAEGTAPTLTTNAADATKNLVDLNSPLDGSKVDLYLVV